MRNALPRRIRTLATVAATSALAVTTLSACGSDGSERAGGGKDTLNVWIVQDASTPVQQELVKRFNGATDSGVQVKLTEVPATNYPDKMRTSMGTGNAPDVFFNWGGGSISDFVGEDMLLDLTPELEKDAEFKETFIPSVLEAGKVGDQYYGIPMRAIQPVILFYNKKLFEKADATPPQTWQEMVDLIDVFQDEDVTPYVVAGVDSWTEQMWMEYLLDRRGGAEVFQRIQGGDASAWGDPAMLETAEAVKQLVDDGAFGKNYKSVNYHNDGASTLFSQDKAAMHLMGSWEYSNQKANQPDFAKDDLGYTAFPALPDGSGDPKAVVGNPSNYWSVNAKVTGAKRAAAIEFLKLAADEEYSQALVDNGDVPPTTYAEKLLDSHESPEYSKFVYQTVKEAPDFTLSWDQALPPKASKTLLDAIEKLFNGQISPQKFVDTMKATGA